MRKYILFIPLLLISILLLNKFYFPFLQELFKGEVKYLEKKSCTEDFTYCINNKYRNNNDSILFFGDSLGLSVSNYLLNEDIDNFKYIGAGSCPFLKDYTPSFATSGCDKQTKTFYKKLQNFNGKNIVYIGNFSAYQDDINFSKGFINLLKIVEKKRINLIIVKPSYKIDGSLTKCRERIFKNDTCKYKKLDEVINISSNNIFEITSNFIDNESGNYFKDNLHLRSSSIPIFYPMIKEKVNEIRNSKYN
jgi:hypothetical protein